MLDYQHPTTATNQFQLDSTRPDDPVEDDQSFVQSLQLGDRHAETALAQRFDRIAKPAVARLSMNRDAKADLYQDAFLAVLNRLRDGALKDSSKLDAYIRGVIRTTFLVYIRRKRLVYVDNIEELAENPLSVKRPDELMEQDTTQRVIALSIDQLNAPRDRELLSAILLRDCSKEEVLGWLRETSKNYDRIKSRGLKRLAAIIRKRYPEFVPRGV